jgi:hypothetical protein
MDVTETMPAPPEAVAPGFCPHGVMLTEYCSTCRDAIGGASGRAQMALDPCATREPAERSLEQQYRYALIDVTDFLDCPKGAGCACRICRAKNLLARTELEALIDKRHER